MISKTVETLEIWSFNLRKILQTRGTPIASKLQSHCALSRVRGEEVRLNCSPRTLRTFPDSYNMTSCTHTLLKHLKVMYYMDSQELTEIVETLSKNILGTLTQEDIDAIEQKQRIEA